MPSLRNSVWRPPHDYLPRRTIGFERIPPAGAQSQVIVRFGFVWAGRYRRYNGDSMRRFFLGVCCAVPLFAVAGCGYRAVGSMGHLSPDVHTLAVPVFTTRTNTYRTEIVMTDAVIREFAARTKFRVSPAADPTADAVLHGTILKESVTPLTYNASIQESSSFVVTVVVSVSLMDREGKVLFEDKNYVFRQQYQSTTDLPTFLQENPAAVERLSRDFARTLVADVLENF